MGACSYFRELVACYDQSPLGSGSQQHLATILLQASLAASEGASTGEPRHLEVRERLTPVRLFSRRDAQKRSASSRLSAAGVLEEVPFLHGHVIENAF